MFDILQKLFFLRKATPESLRLILSKERFVYTDDTIATLLKGNQKGVRYGNVVLDRREGDTTQKRFFKVIIDGTLRTYKLFRRQVEIANALHRDKNHTFPTIVAVKHSFATPVPYAVFETREQGETFGFMHDSPAFYETFKEEEMDKLVDVIYSFHLSGKKLDTSIWGYTQKLSSSVWHYKQEAQQFLDTVIKHKIKDGSFMEKSVKDILAEKFNIPNIEKSIMNVFTKMWHEVNSSRAEGYKYLVHADMQIDNVYRRADGMFELIDFEWVGSADNPVIAIMYDYGNLRARAWSSPKFQQMLDTSMHAQGIKHYDEKVVTSALTLGKLRSSLMMSRYHMDYHNTVKKDKRTEEDYYAMYPKTLASLEGVLHESL